MLNRYACIVTLTAFAAACSPHQSSEPAARAAGGGAPVPVVTARAETRAVPVSVNAVGTVEASSTVDIRAQVTGQLSAIHFREGQEVAKGAPLFSLDLRPFRAAVQQAEAVLARDTAQAANARAQLTRYTDLFNRGLIPRDQYETQTATANALQATLDADRAALETARLNLQYAEIRSPMAGRTGALNVHVGDLVRANDTTPLVVINRLSPVFVAFSIPGRLLGEIRRYQGLKPLSVTVRPSGARAASATEGAVATAGTTPPPAAQIAEGETGTVSFIDNAVDPTTGTIKLKATFDNRGRVLWPGLFVQVALTLTTDPHALTVPAVAVQTGQQGQFVYVVKSDHTVELRPVRLDRQVGGDAVIAEGLNAGEQVVTDGQLRLTPGARVTVKAS